MPTLRPPAPVRPPTFQAAPRRLPLRRRLRWAPAVLGAALVLAACDPGTDATQAHQSPIALSRRAISVTSQNLPTLAFAYNAGVALDVVNTGSPDEEATVRANVPAGSGSLTVSGTTYDLLQFHWHTPSEHLPLGKSFPMEMHLVHKSRTSDTLLVIGVLIEAGASSTALAPIFSDLPPAPQQARAVTGFDLNRLLPGGRTSFRYAGSLTTAPYTEGVKWIVLRSPLPLSAQQIGAFQALFPHHNSREEQEVNGRRVYTDAAL